MRMKREMGIDSRLRYYEAFIAVRDIIRLVEAACEQISTCRKRTTEERSIARVEQLKAQCMLSALEVKRANFDKNSDVVSTPCDMELRSIELLFEEAKELDIDDVSIDYIRQIATESAQFFARLHP